MTETDNNIVPNHYKGDFTDIDVIDAAKIFNMNFNLGNVLKYIVRAGIKDPDKEIQDLEKASEYLKREIEFLKNK